MLTLRYKGRKAVLQNAFPGQDITATTADEVLVALTEARTVPSGHCDRPWTHMREAVRDGSIIKVMRFANFYYSVPSNKFRGRGPLEDHDALMLVLRERLDEEVVA